jgi:hypothetical protein
MASDRMSCHSATANQVRLILHTAAYYVAFRIISRNFERACIYPQVPGCRTWPLCRLRDIVLLTLQAVQEVQQLIFGAITTWRTVPR